ncbi:MAG: Flp pilus assembly protein CpaB [Actinomycetota bacterium]
MRWPTLRRRLPLSSKVLFGVAAALIALSFLVVRSEVDRAHRAQAAAGPMAAVVVAAHEIAAGETLGADDVRVAELPAVFLPPGAANAIDDVIGQVSDAPVTTGEALNTARLAASAFGTIVTAGNVVVTVAFASVPDGLSTADRVDAFATYAGARPYTTVVGEDLHILSIAPPASSFDGPGATAITLDVDPETARQLLQAAATGALGLAARASVTPSPSVGTSPAPGVAVTSG